MAALLAHHWPGNVRELRNVVERSVCRMVRPERPLETVVIDPFRFCSPSPSGRGIGGGRRAAESAEADRRVTPTNFRDAVRDFEAGLLRQALADARFNQRRAADALGLTYDQFRHLLRTHALVPGNRKGQRSEAVAPKGVAPLSELC
jgi:psp operon transcriptional activator